MDNNEFIAELLATFREEADEHLSAISSGLMDLEKDSSSEDAKPVVEIVYRAAHSLKGAARAVEMIRVESLCQSAEGVLAGIKYGRIAITPQILDTLHRAADAIRELLANPEAASTQKIAVIKAELAANEAVGNAAVAEPEAGDPSAAAIGAAEEDPEIHLELAADCSETPESPLLEQAEPTVHRASDQAPAKHRITGRPVGHRPDARIGASGTIRVQADRLDAVLLQAEEMLAAKLTSAQRAKDFQDTRVKVRQLQRALASIYPEIHKSRQGSMLCGSGHAAVESSAETKKLLSMIERQQEFAKSLASSLDGLARSAENDARLLDAMVDNLLQDAKKLLMLPCSTLTQPLPKMVRDLARDLGKEAELVVAGAEVEIDKRILEKLKDPLVHLLRNSVDHGMESPDERERQGKARKGSIRLSVSQVDSSRVDVVVSDDGAGIDLARVRDAAVKNGIVSAEDAPNLEEREIISLIFQSGITTSRLITDVSGRGLGMAIVNSNIEELGGAVSVDTQKGLGTTFRITLPVTHATFRGIFVQSGGQIFVVPTSQVEQVCRVHPQEVLTIEGRETISVDGMTVSLVNLTDVLGTGQGTPPGQDNLLHVLVLQSGETRIGFRVDDVLSEQEVLVKRLGRQLSRVRNIAGATVLGSGQVVAILNVRDLVKSAVSAAGTGVSRIVEQIDEGKAGQSILVVEDSITSRTLMKNILESAGYDVTIAVDGLDALGVLKSTTFDLVISDVEMPRMDGFTLTENIRADKAFEGLPVVIVTSLESREHRERGIDVGANAYIVKSSFDQGNLLETISRLI